MFIDKNILYAIFKIENVFINIYFIGGVIKIKKYVSLFIFLLVLLIPIQVAVKNNNGYSITMVSRKHEKKNNKLYIYLTVKGYDFNTKKYSSNYNFSFTISS